MITVQLHNLIFACKYNRRALRKVTSSFEEVLYAWWIQKPPKSRLSTSTKVLNRKTKISPFLITKKIEHIRQKIKIWVSWAVKWAVIRMAHTISHGTNTWQSESSGNDSCTRDIITRNYARFFNTKTTNSVSTISIERRYTKLLQIWTTVTR